MVIDGNQFCHNTIIDLVVLPNMNTSSIILQFVKDFDLVVILDTKGDLHRSFRSFGWCSENSHETKKFSYTFVSTIEELLQKINQLFSLTGILLIIDSITFVCDVSPIYIKSVAALLWSLIYKTQATVITINHYKISMQNRVLTLVPRMGRFWCKIVSYQVVFNDSHDISKFKIIENSLNLL